MPLPHDEDAPAAAAADLLPPGWGRTRLSTFWHWFDAAAAGAAPRTSLCRVLPGYRGETVSEIARWEIDPSVCEICRGMLTARARGVPYAESGADRRIVAIVPLGLPDRLRAFYQDARDAAHGSEAAPFHQTLEAFRDDGVTRPFLAALLRYDARVAGRPWRRPLRWNEWDLDEVRESDTATRVRIVRERAGD